MAIYRAKDYIDAYRIRAMSPDINDLSGRDGRPDITQHVSSLIADELSFAPADVIADIGCGDGTLLKIALARGVPAGQLTGILPTDEEVQRVNAKLRRDTPGLTADIAKVGFATATSLSDASIGKCICNGVLLLLPDQETAKASLRELARITQQGGLILVGEVPDIDEGAQSNPDGAQTGDAAAPKRAWRVYRDLGFVEVVRRIRNRIAVTFDRRVHLVSPPTTFWISPQELEKAGVSVGLSLLRKYRSPLLSESGQPIDNERRWNYVFRKA